MHLYCGRHKTVFSIGVDNLQRPISCSPQTDSSPGSTPSSTTKACVKIQNVTNVVVKTGRDECAISNIHALHQSVLARLGCHAVSRIRAETVVLDIQMSYWTFRCRTGYLDVVLDSQMSYWTFRCSTGHLDVVLEIQMQYWTFRCCTGHLDVVLDIQVSYWTFRCST